MCGGRSTVDVFGILVHRMTESLVYTVNKLSQDKSNLIIIHVDRKSDISDFDELLSDNVYLLKDRVSVDWAGVTQIIATLELISFSLRFEFNSFSLISGDDILVVDHRILKKRLASLECNYIAVQDSHTFFVDPNERLKFCYPDVYFSKKTNLFIKMKKALFRLGSFLGFFRNKHYNKLPKLHKGTQWFTLNYDCIFYISEYLKENPWYLDAFMNSFCSDEVFFHTIVMNSKFADTIHKMTVSNLPLRALRYIDWETGPEYPKILVAEDVESIYQKDVLFARKMSEEYNYNELIKMFG